MMSGLPSISSITVPVPFSAYQLLVTDPRPAVLLIIAVAIVFLSIGLVTVDPLRQRLEDRHGVGTIGRTQTVDRQAIKMQTNSVRPAVNG